METESAVIPLQDLIMSLEMESIRVRKLVLSKSGTLCILKGLESLLSSIRKLEGASDLETWFNLQQTPEGLKFDKVKALIERNGLKEHVLRCFWDGDEQTRPQKGKPFSVMRCSQPEMGHHIYLRYVGAHGGRLPNKRQIPIAFAMQLYVEFMLHKPVDYRSMRLRNNASKSRNSGATQRCLHEDGVLGCKNVPAPQVSSMKGCEKENVQMAESSFHDTKLTTSWLPQGSSGSIHKSSCALPSLISNEASSLAEDSISSLSSLAPTTPSVKLEDSQTWVDKSWQTLEGAIRQGLHDCNLQLEEMHEKVRERDLQLQEARLQIQELAMQLNEARQQLEGTKETRQKLEETAQLLKEARQQLEGNNVRRQMLEETMQQLKEARQQLEEQDALLEDMRCQLKASDQELKEVNCRHQENDKELREEMLRSRIALHNARHFLCQFASVAPHVFEPSATLSIFLRISDPQELGDCPPVLDSVCGRSRGHVCSICRVGFDGMGWFTIGCGHSFHMLCIIQNLARAATCTVCDAAIPKALYKSIGMEDLYPAKYRECTRGALEMR